MTPLRCSSRPTGLAGRNLAPQATTTSTSKFSPDGSSWHEAIIVDKDTGQVSFPNTSLHVGGGSSPWTVFGNNISYSAGYVGIGGAPTQPLTVLVNDSSRQNATVEFVHSDTSGKAQISLMNNVGVSLSAGVFGSSFGAGLASLASFGSTSGLVFMTNAGIGSGGADQVTSRVAGDGSTVEYLRITASGREMVNGLGVEPVCARDVNGPVRCKTYTRSGVPAASAGDGMMIFVTDPSSGSPQPFWSFGGSGYDATGVVLA